MKEVVTAVFWISLGCCFIIFTTGGQGNIIIASRRDVTRNWIDALTICSEGHYTMASFHYFNNGNLTNLSKDTLLRDLHGSSAWLYDIEVISRDSPFLVASAPEDEHLKGLCQGSLNPNTMTRGMTKEPFSYNESNQRCEGKGNGTLMTVEYATIRHVNGLYAEAYFGQPFWIGGVNQAQLIQNDNIRTRCLLLDGDGQLRSDNCFNQHRVICTNATLKPTLTYLNSRMTVKPYHPSTTTPQTESTVTLETGTPTRVATTTDMTTDITRGHISSSQPPTAPVSTVNTDTPAHDKERQNVIIIGSVSGMLVLISIGIHCWVCRRRRQRKRRSGISHVPGQVRSSTNEPYYLSLDPDPIIYTADGERENPVLPIRAFAVQDTHEEDHEYNTINDRDDEMEGQGGGYFSPISNTDSSSKLQHEDDGYLKPVSKGEYPSPVSHIGTNSDNTDYLMPIG